MVILKKIWTFDEKISMLEEFSGFLKYVCGLTRFMKLHNSIKLLKKVSSVSEVMSPIKINCHTEIEISPSSMLN